MDKLEHTFKTLGKFLAIASAVKLYKEIYGDDIPQIEILRILNDLQIISDDYLYPKYSIKNQEYLILDTDNEDSDVGDSNSSNIYG